MCNLVEKQKTVKIAENLMKIYVLNETIEQAQFVFDTEHHFYLQYCKRNDITPIEFIKVNTTSPEWVQKQYDSMVNTTGPE